MKWILACLLFGAVSTTASALHQWDRTLESDRIVYTPIGIDSRKTLRITLFTPLKIGNAQLEEWLILRAKAQQRQLGKALQPWKAKPEKNGEWGASNSYISKERRKAERRLPGRQVAGWQGVPGSTDSVDRFDVAADLRHAMG